MSRIATRSKPRPRLTRSLQLQERSRTADGAGGYDEDWVTLGRPWAQVARLTGRERRTPAAEETVQRYRITLRAVPEGQAGRPRADQRFLLGTRVLNIQAVAEHDAEGLYLTCFAQEELTS
jgi:head-tail adaptor